MLFPALADLAAALADAGDWALPARPTPPAAAAPAEPGMTPVGEPAPARTYVGTLWYPAYTRAGAEIITEAGDDLGVDLGPDDSPLRAAARRLNRRKVELVGTPRRSPDAPGHDLAEIIRATALHPAAAVPVGPVRPKAPAPPPAASVYPGRIPQAPPPPPPPLYQLRGGSGTTWTHPDPHWLAAWVRQADPPRPVPLVPRYTYGAMSCVGGVCRVRGR
jgi:hypothetical protein